MGSNVYQTITDRIIDSLKAGVVPWQRPWRSPGEYPRSLASGKKYRGINAFILSTAEYASPYWLTYRQVRDRDGHVRRGETGYPCVYWNWTEKEDAETGKKIKRPFLKRYTVFNVEQCEGIPCPAPLAPPQEHRPIEACEALVAGMPNRPDIRHGGSVAAYSPVSDRIQMPPMESFDSPEAYYAVLYHELTHSTGHVSRLARSEIADNIGFDADPYSREELVAEMGSAFLCGHTGIEKTVLDNSASYIDSWLGRLSGDSRLVVTAGAQAQKAADYILGETPDYSGK